VTLSHLLRAPTLAPAVPHTRRRGATTRASAYISRELGPELLDLITPYCEPGTLRGVGDVVGDYVAIAVAVFVAERLGGLLPWMVAVVYVGVRQRYLANLCHEALHVKCVGSPRTNLWTGRLALAWPLAQSFGDYDREHRVHHRRLGRDDDPKVIAYRAKGLTSPVADKVEFLWRFVLLPALGPMPIATVKTIFTKKKESQGEAAGRLAFWCAAGAVAWATGTLHLVWKYWVPALIFVRPVISLLTDLSNHLGRIDNDDPVLKTRNWTSNTLGRHLLGGHHDDMFHWVHHALPGVLHRHQPRVAALIAERYPRADDIPFCDGFFWARSPGVPAVLDDIVAGLKEPATLSTRLPSEPRSA
jgi:fatty acid desaturase